MGHHGEVHSLVVVILRDGRVLDLPEVKAKRLVRKGRATLSAMRQPQERAIMPKPVVR